METRECKKCKTNIDHKRKDAKFCSRECKIYQHRIEKRKKESFQKKLDYNQSILDSYKIIRDSIIEANNKNK